MKLLRFFPILFLTLGLISHSDFVSATDENPNNYKVLSSKGKRISTLNIQDYLADGDSSIEQGKFEKAKESYDKARNLAKQLSSFYRDLNGSFRGIDARIPREMEEKGRESIKLWAESNARLAALYKRQEQSEVAVPLLVEIIRLMSPTSTEGREAYTNLIEIGFVETPYRG